jgi:small-conductance mechanosensitive channel
MPSSELRRKTFFLLLYAGIITILLMIVPSDAAMRAYLTGFLPVDVRADAPQAGMANQFGETIIGLVINVLHVFKIVLWMALVIMVIRYVNFLAFNVILRNATQNEISSLMKSVISIVVSIVAFFIIFQSQYPNVELAPLFTGSTILGIVVGLALQDTLGNLFAGIALQADQSFQVGDVISIQSNRWAGVIEQVSWRGIKIRTFQNKVVVVSNAVLGREIVEVAPKDNLNARLVFFNTLYSNYPTATIHALREAIARIDNVSPKFRPIVRIRNLGDNGIDWEIKYWLEDYARHNDTDAAVRQRIWYVFKREKISFAYPTRTLYIERESVGPDAEESVNEVFERLADVSIFAPLTAEESQRIAEGVVAKVFSPDEPIVRRGQEGSSMFVIHRGSVKVQVREGGKVKVVMKLAEGDFFGEMGLFTGEPRTATVIALEETEVLEITHDSLKPLLEDNPELVERFSEIIAERRAKLSAVSVADTLPGETEQTSVFRSIRRFFGLGTKKT